MAATARINVVGPLNSGTGSRALLGIRVDGPKLVPVVLLPVPRKTMDDPEALLRLRKETDRAVALDHPSILKVLGLVQTKRGLARATAFANGEPLRRVLTRAVRLPPQIAARIVADAAAGVHYAHLAANEEGIPLVHGDLRPETLMTSYTGVTMVTGYGALSVAPTEAGGKRVPGRRKYSAPEQILGGRAASTQQTDVYLLGLVLWESLTGAVPFADATDPDRAIVSAELSLASNPRIPDLLRPVLAKAIAKKGTDRHPTALALREAIESAVPLASQEQVAEWLESQFIGDPIAVAQKKLVERALDQAKGLAQTPPPLPVPPAPSPAAAAPAPAPVTAAAPPATPAPPPVAAQPAAPAPIPAPVVAPRMVAITMPPVKHAPAAKAAPEAVAPRTQNGPVAMAAVLALIAGFGIGWGVRGIQESPPAPPVKIVDEAPLKARDDLKVEIVRPADVPPALDPLQNPSEPGIVMPPESVVAGAPTPTPSPTAPVAAPHATPAPVSPTPGVEMPTLAPAAPPPGLVMPTLEIFSVPEVEVLQGTRSLGKTPVTATMIAGKQTLTLVNHALGIRVTREVEVAQTGTTHASLRVGVGTIGFHAPVGAKVYLDRKPIGVAPIERRYNVYEGPHQVQIEVDGKKWEETFQVADGDWLSYTAQPDARPGAPLRFSRDVSPGTKPEISLP